MKRPLHFILLLSMVLSCSDEQSSESGLKIPENGINIEIEQRHSTSLEGYKSDLDIEIGDITGGHTFLELKSDDNILLSEFISDGEELSFTFDQIPYTIKCVELDNQLIGTDVGYFNIQLSEETLEITEQINNENLKKIEKLIDLVRTSDIVFIRNGTEHTGVEAANHLSGKYEKVRNQIKSPENFIDQIASKSSFSGEEYTVRLQNGEVLKASEWFYAQLEQL